MADPADPRTFQFFDRLGDKEEAHGYLRSWIEARCPQCALPGRRTHEASRDGQLVWMCLKCGIFQTHVTT